MGICSSRTGGKTWKFTPPSFARNQNTADFLPSNSLYFFRRIPSTR